MFCQRRRIDIVSEEPIRHRLVGGPMVFHVQDRRLLPKAPLHLQSDNLTTPIGKRIGQYVGDPRTDRVTPHRLLIGEGTQFQLD